VSDDKAPRAPFRALPRVATAFDITLRVTAVAIAVSLAIAAWHDVSQAYDVWYYHLPFAARLAGMMDAGTYAFAADNQVRFEGFPLLGELLQGLVWRATGHIQTTNLVSLAALFALPIFLRRVFAVPLHLALLALLAIPLVHIHATSSYVDLPANVCATLLLLCVYRTLVAGVPPTPRFLAGCTGLAAAATNAKFQLVPVVTLASAALVVGALRGLTTWHLATADTRKLVVRRIVVIAIAFPVVFATPLKNAALHGNPVWPVELRVLGRSLPYAEEAYASSPPHLAEAPGPLRFVRSALEVDNRPIATHRRWSLDQWAPPDEPGYRMGGFFGAYVAIQLLALVWTAWRRRTRKAIVAVALFGAVSVLASIVPQSHELRYYMHWMLLLTSLNLVLWAESAPWAVGIVATSALAVVTWSTDAAYLYASGSTFQEFVGQRVERSVIESARPGERLCIARPPFTILYAPLFHPGTTHTVQEASSDADCGSSRQIR